MMLVSQTNTYSMIKKTMYIKINDEHKVKIPVMELLRNKIESLQSAFNW